MIKFFFIQLLAIFLKAKQVPKPLPFALKPMKVSFPCLLLILANLLFNSFFMSLFQLHLVLKMRLRSRLRLLLLIQNLLKMERRRLENERRALKKKQKKIRILKGELKNLRILKMMNVKTKTEMLKQ